MKAKAFNQQAFLEIACYCVLSGVLLYYVQSEKYLSYVTPRMKPYLYFTAVILLLWALASLPKLVKAQHKIRSSHCFVLALPILLLLLPHSPLSTSSLAANYVVGSAFAKNNAQSTNQAASLGASDNISKDSVSLTKDTVSSDTLTEPDASAENSFGSTGESDGVITDSSIPAEVQGDAAESSDPAAADVEGNDSFNSVDTLSTEPPGLDSANKIITVSNDDFGMWLSELYVNMEQYQGYTVVMTGFVFKDSDMIGNSEFAIARLIMSCCAADLSPGGLICHYERSRELDENSWVTIEGTLFIGFYEFDGVKYDDPQITITKITPATEVEGYVYPYY